MKRFFLIIFLLPLLFSCRTLNPSVMFKTGKNYPFMQTDSTAMKVQSEYKLAPYDEIELDIYSNNGYKLVDITGNAGGGNSSQVNYNLESDGFVKLPLLGRLNMQGMTVIEAEKMLEEKYKAYYNSPFILLKVLNRRVFIFMGEGSALVVPLLKDNMTLIEALASAGGIPRTGKAYSIRLIRGSLKNPGIYKIDLSSIDAMKKADLQLQSNDIIYIEPTRNISESILVKISPALGLLTTILLTIAIFHK